MDRHGIEVLKSKVSCEALLDRASFALDAKESTRRALKFRRERLQIVIVIHGGRGWFDPLSDAKGDVFSLAIHLGASDFRGALREVSALVDYRPRNPIRNPPVRALSAVSMLSRWSARSKPWRGSPSWAYLTGDRFLPENVIQSAIAQDLLREGPHGSMWAKHADAFGAVQGWEERGPKWRGFSTAGAKTLFRFGSGLRFCVTEAAIDALSLAALEQQRSDSCYVSTGGGWSPVTGNSLKALFELPGATVVAATDDDEQGEVYAERLAAMAAENGAPCPRLRPPHGDWNNTLKHSRA